MDEALGLPSALGLEADRHHGRKRPFSLSAPVPISLWGIRGKCVRTARSASPLPPGHRTRAVLVLGLLEAGLFPSVGATNERRTMKWTTQQEEARARGIRAGAVCVFYLGQLTAVQVVAPLRPFLGHDSAPVAPVPEGFQLTEGAGARSVKSPDRGESDHNRVTDW